MNYSKIGIVIPTYNEAQNIGILLQQINAICPNAFVIIVDDNSQDGTPQIVQQWQQQKKEFIHLIQRPAKMGIGSAHTTGFLYAINTVKADIIFSMDADLSHNPKSIPKFIDKIKQGYDVIIGSRYIPNGKIIGWAPHRHIMSKGANVLSKLFLQIPINDFTSGYRCYTARALQTIPLKKIKSNGYSYLEEILYWCHHKKFKIGEIPITFTEREQGASKLGKKEIVNFLKTLIRLKLEDFTRQFSDKN